MMHHRVVSPMRRLALSAAVIALALPAATALLRAAPPRPPVSTTTPVAIEGIPARAAAEYEAILTQIGEKRAAFATRYRAAAEADRPALRDEAARYLLATIVDQLFPRWLGTPWGLGKNSTSTRPHLPGMTVGCSYFVTSILENAGLRLDDRYAFAQAPALRIQASLAPAAGAIHRFTSIAPARLADEIAALGDGLYLIGLDRHVGFVVVRDSTVRFVHASYTGDRQVSDERLADAAAIAASRRAGYFVSPLLAISSEAHDTRDFLIDRWLRAAPVRFVPR
jgi:hypothetical protein